MRIQILPGETDITNLTIGLTLSGDITQAARKLEVTFLQDDRDQLVPAVTLDVGYTVQFFDDDNVLVFQGNIYQLERDRAKSQMKFTAHDNLFVLNRSKATRKFKDSLPEDIARSICSEMGIKVGSIVSTGVPVSFIANAKTGYQIIQGAYSEASKVNQKKYQQIMRGDELCVIEKGELCGFIADSTVNLTDSIYKASIEQLVNAVKIISKDGENVVGWVSDSESMSRYSMVQEVYKEQDGKDSQVEAKALLNKPEYEGQLTVVPADFSLVSGYSLIVRDSSFNGQFYIKSDSHSFAGGVHTAKLALQFENIMETVEVQHEKAEKT